MLSLSLKWIKPPFSFTDKTEIAAQLSLRRNPPPRISSSRFLPILISSYKMYYKISTVIKCRLLACNNLFSLTPFSNLFIQLFRYFFTHKKANWCWIFIFHKKQVLGNKIQDFVVFLISYPRLPPIKFPSTYTECSLIDIFSLLYKPSKFIILLDLSKVDVEYIMSLQWTIFKFLNNLSNLFDIFPLIICYEIMSESYVISVVISQAIVKPQRLLTFW